MPCLDGGPSTSDREFWERELRHNSEVAQAFCALCQWLEKHHCTKLIEDVPEAYKWWTEHKERDNLKRLREMTEQKRTTDRAALLAGLNSYQKGLLGIRD